MSPASLDFSPLHLRPPRMRYNPQDQTLIPNYDVLASVGMEDAAAFLTPGQRKPPELTATGTNGGGPVDRFYLTFDLTEAAVRYVQQDTWGSDHQALMLTLDTARAAEIIPWRPGRDPLLPASKLASPGKGVLAHGPAERLGTGSHFARSPSGHGAPSTP